MIEDGSDRLFLKPSRMHEVCGPAAVSFAMRFAAQMAGDVIWVRESWLSTILNPAGFEGLDPARLIVARTKNLIDALAITEDALRDGAVPLVVVEVTAPLSLTAGRRLQLAAKTGGTTGLCLISEGMGSNAAETRWRCTPVFDPEDSTLQHWALIKNKSGTLGAWHVRWTATARRVYVVSPAGQRPGS